MNKQVINISLSNAGLINAEIQTGDDINIRSISAFGLELPGAINGVIGDNVGVTSFGEIVLEKNNGNSINSIYFIENSEAYTLVNRVKIYTAKTSPQGLVNFKIR